MGRPLNSHQTRGVYWKIISEPDGTYTLIAEDMVNRQVYNKNMRSKSDLSKDFLEWKEKSFEYSDIPLRQLQHAKQFSA